MIPTWYRDLATWAALMAGLMGVLLLALYVADKAMTELFKTIGVYKIVVTALWDHAAKERASSKPDAHQPECMQCGCSIDPLSGECQSQPWHFSGHVDGTK